MNGNARAVFRDCIFEANRLVDPNYGSRGGAVYHGNPNSNTILNDPLKFVRCKFIQNEIIAKEVLKAKIALFSEKPAALSYLSAKKLTDLARKNRTKYVIVTSQIIRSRSIMTPK